jgi:hypothetical protein
MPAFTLTKITEFAAVEVGGIPINKLVATRYAMRLCGADAAPVWLQGGAVYGEGGDEIAKDELPDWFDEELRKCSPASLHAVGWQNPTDGHGRPRRG